MAQKKVSIAEALSGTEFEYPPIAERGQDDEWFHDGREWDPCNLGDRSYPDLGPYPNREVISALRKEIKLGRHEQALYWLTVMLELGDGSKAHLGYIIRQLWIVSAEDLFDQGIVIQTAAVLANFGLAAETDHLYQLVYRMCDARKLHDTESGRRMNYLWGKAIGHLRRGDYRKIPSYAVDQHTYRGKVLIKRGYHVDQRFNGTDMGRISIAYMYLRDKVVGPKSDWDEGFWAEFAEFKEETGMKLQKLIRDRSRPRDQQTARDPDAGGTLFDQTTGEVLG